MLHHLSGSTFSMQALCHSNSQILDTKVYKLQEKVVNSLTYLITLQSLTVVRSSDSITDTKTSKNSITLNVQMKWQNLLNSYIHEFLSLSCSQMIKRISYIKYVTCTGTSHEACLVLLIKVGYMVYQVIQRGIRHLLLSRSPHLRSFILWTKLLDLQHNWL